MSGQSHPNILPRLECSDPCVVSFSAVARADQLHLSPSRREHVVFDGKSLFVSCKGRDPVGVVWYDPAQKEIIQRKGP